MKTLKSIIMPAVLITGLAACGTKDGTSIAGIYVTQFENEFTHANDTLAISAYSLSAHTYTVERHTGYNKVREGKVQPREFKQQSWNATYIPENQILKEAQAGKMLYFKPDQQELLFGSTVYKQIK